VDKFQARYIIICFRSKNPTGFWATCEAFQIKASQIITWIIEGNPRWYHFKQSAKWVEKNQRTLGERYALLYEPIQWDNCTFVKYLGNQVREYARKRRLQLDFPLDKTEN
jgi:hypothetical protein